MLANQSAMDAWQEKASIQAQANLHAMQATLQGGGLQSQTWREYWQGICDRAEGPEFERHGRVAMVKCCGALDYKYSFWAYIFDSSCYAGIASKVNAAKEDSGIEKIVLYVDSPGGAHHGLLEASNAIWEARQAGKEVVAVVDPTAASAGYWLASQANRIVALESGWVGSLGSQVMLYSVKRSLTEAGIDIEVLRADVSPNKNLGHPYEEISDEAREERQGWVDMAGNQFVEHVSRGRDKSRSYILEDYGQGKMFFAPEAIKRGMVDAVGSLQAELSVEDGDDSKRGKKGRRMRHEAVESFLIRD